MPLLVERPRWAKRDLALKLTGVERMRASEVGQ